MLKSLLKTLLAAAALLLAAPANADEINATLDLTASSWNNSGSSRGNMVSTVNVEKEHLNKNNGFNNGWAGFAYTQFTFDIPEGQSVTKAELKFTYNSSKYYGFSLYYLTAEIAKYTEETFANNAEVAPRGTTERTLIQECTYNKHPNDLAYTVDVTDAVKATASQGFVIFQYTGTDGGGDIYGKGCTDTSKVPSLVITTASANTRTTYTVNFLDESGNAIQEAKTYEGTIGEEITAPEEALQDIKTADAKYAYKSGNDALTLSEKAEENVFNLVFAKLPLYNWTLNMLDPNGGVLETATGTAYQGENVYMPHHKYILKDEVLYILKDVKGDTDYRKEIQDIQKDETASVDYVVSDITDAIDFVEAETLPNMQRVTASYVASRSSNAAAGWNGSGARKYTTVEAGKYYLTVGLYRGSGNFTVNFLQGNNDKGNGEENPNIIASATTTGSNLNEITTDAFSFTEKTDIYISRWGGMSANNGIDYIILRKAGEAEYAYTLEYKAGENVVKTVEGSVVAGEKVTYAGALIEGGVAYIAEPQADGSYSLEVGESGASLTVNCTEKTGSSASLYDPAAINGFTTVACPQASNGVFGYASSDVELMEIGEGTWQLEVGMVSLSGEPFKVEFCFGDVVATDATLEGAAPAAVKSRAESAPVVANVTTHEFSHIATHPTNKLTLRASGNDQAGISYILANKISDETSGVESIAVDAAADAPAYNIYGQPVAPDYRGIVIKNGRKFYNR